VNALQTPCTRVSYSYGCETAHDVRHASPVARPASGVISSVSYPLGFDTLSLRGIRTAGLRSLCLTYCSRVAWHPHRWGSIAGAASRLR
jgi:hypothetical protein